MKPTRNDFLAIGTLVPRILLFLFFIFYFLFNYFLFLIFSFSFFEKTQHLKKKSKKSHNFFCIFETVVEDNFAPMIHEAPK